MRVLLVEDDADLADGISRALTQAGHAVDGIRDGTLADEVLATQDFDLLILDLNLPGLDGFEILKRLRKRGRKVPVLVLTARGEVEDRISGLDLGADDYMTKPFAVAELMARARALLRRGAAGAAARIVHGPLVLDTAGRRLTLEGEAVELPRRELNVLEILLGNVGRVVSKERMAEHLFSFDEETSLNAIELYVHRLRKKLGPAGVSIRTVRGLGYLLDKP
jgi:two-component system, OmpR family, response regulator